MNVSQGLQERELIFPSEELLQQAVAQLFARMDWLSGIQILQGAREHGKDLVFRSLGTLRQPITCACVVKNKPFSGVAGKSRNLRTVIEQVEQAFNIPFIDEQRRETFVDEVYVINPHPTSVEAMQSIQGILSNRRIVFLTGIELYRLFLQYWPAFLQDEAGVLAQFEMGLREISGSNKALSSLAAHHGLAVTADGRTVYVPPAFERSLAVYTLRNSPYEIVSKAELSDPWLRSDVGLLTHRVDELIALLSHVRLWAFPGLRCQPELPRIQAIHADLLTAIHDGFRRAFKARSGRMVSILDQIPPNVELVIGASDRDSITALAAAATQLTKEWTDDIEQTLSVIASSSREFGDVETPDDLLNSPRFRLACLVDDCFRLAPNSLLQISLDLQFRFSPELHRRATEPLLITGGPGSGKTSFCTRNALEDARQLIEAREVKRVPAYVAINRLPQKLSPSFEGLFLAESRHSALLPKVTVRSSEAPIRLYLDGFDEVNNEERRAKILDLARQGVAQNANRQIIVTSRDYVADPCLSWLPRIKLSGLEPSQILQLAEQWLDGIEPASAFVRQLEKMPSLLGLARTPLLATVTVLVFKRTGRIPPDRTRLYEAFVDLLCGGWDHAKGIVRGSEFGLTPKKSVLGILAHNVHRRGRTQFMSALISNCARQVLPNQSARTYERFWKELLVDGIITQTGDAFQFRHLSFQEYCAARHVISDPREATRFGGLWKEAGVDGWWHEVLKFVIGMHASRTKASAWMDSQLSKREAKALEHLLDESFPDDGGHAN
jgi:hypothetical protein